jgi:hypothetical protein
MEKIKFEGSNWKIKVEERSRNRMKLIVKLSKDEALGFKNWSSIVRPDTISDEDFVKQIFFNGIEHLNDKLTKMSQEILDNPELRQQLEASGFSASSIEQSIPKP